MLILFHFYINNFFFLIYIINLYTNFIFNLFYILNIIFYLSILSIILHRQNFLIMTLFLELMYVSILLSFIVITLITKNYIGFFISFILIIIIACESVIGLGILLNLYKDEYTINQNAFMLLKG